MKKILSLFAVAALLATAPLHADVISVNFAESDGTAGHANQQLAATTSAGGGSGVDAANWNNVAGIFGTSGALNDRDGAATGTTVTWGSDEVWGDGSAETDATAGVGNAQMLRGYLDDRDGADANGIGVTIDFSGIGYTTYDVIMFGSTDTDGGTYHDANIGGNIVSTTGDKDQYGTNPNLDATRTWVATGLSGSSLSISLASRDAGSAIRGSVGGIQIVNTSAVPEPGTFGLITLAGIVCVLRRRK